MPARSPARYLAPLAIVAIVILVIVIASNSSGSGHAPATAAGGGHPRHAGPRYGHVVVHTGDSLSGIAVHNHISVARIEALNPQLDPNALRVGQRIKLRP